MSTLHSPHGASPQPGSRPPLSRHEAGFTLIEVLVSALLVVLIAGATARALISTSHYSADQRFRSQADSVASQDQARLRGLSDEQLDNYSQTRTVNLGGATFTVTSSSRYLDSNGGSGCTTSAAAYFKITSVVSWTEGFSTPTPITVESVLSRPVSGDLVAQAADQTEQPLSGVSVKAVGTGTPSSTETATTGDGGCVEFAGLTAGPYNVTVTPGQGYVDPDGKASTAGTATVTPSSPASTTGNPFHFGLAGSIVGHFTTALPGAAGEADTLAWLGGSGAAAMSKIGATTSATPATALTTGALFPFYSATTQYTSNYAAWAGQCLQEEPPTGYDRYTVQPGSTNRQNIQEPLLDLVVNYYNGSTTAAVKPAHVWIRFSSTAGPSCVHSWHPMISPAATIPATGWLANPGQPFASTATTGSTASAASSSSPEAGSLAVCVDYTPSGSNQSYAQTTTGITNTNFTATPVPTTLTIAKGTKGSCP